MKKLILALVVATMCGMGVGCSKDDEMDDKDTPETNVPQKIIDIFPTASSIAEEGSLTTAMDKDGHVLGYVLESKPASDGIVGKFGETPLEILFDGKKVVMNVELLPNQETEGFVSMVVNSGLLKSWDGLGVDAALNKEVDAVAGATMTSESVIKTFRVAVTKNMK